MAHCLEGVLDDTKTITDLSLIGNYHFNNGNWKQAIWAYTEAISLCSVCSKLCAMLYANRCVSLLKELRYDQALHDAATVVEMFPRWWRGHFRMGQVYLAVHWYQKAELCFKEAYIRDSRQREVMKALNCVRHRLFSPRKVSMLETIMEHPGMSDDEEDPIFLSHRVAVVHFLRDNYRVEQNSARAEMRERAQKSRFFQLFLINEHHVCEALYYLSRMIVMDGIILSHCEKSIAELSTAARIDVCRLKLPPPLTDKVMSVLRYLLALHTPFHEDVCVCYTYLDALPPNDMLKFLDECIGKYPFNAYFVGKRPIYLSQRHDLRGGLMDIETAMMLNPSNDRYLYHRADIMQQLHPRVSVEATMRAYQDFLRRSDPDDPLVPFAHFNTALMYKKMAKSALEAGNGTMYREFQDDVVKHARCFIEAEKRQMATMYLPAREAFFKRLKCNFFKPNVSHFVV